MAATILVLEREPYWTPELQRQFLTTDVKVRGCRKWSELSAAIQSDPSGLSVIDLADFAADCLTGLAAIHSSRLIVISSPQYAELEFALRDAGAAAFFPDLPTGEQLARCCRRWLS